MAQFLDRYPITNARFRQHVWSRIAFSEPELYFLAHHLHPGDLRLAVDVGAARGDYAHVLSRFADRVLAFEPNPAFADLWSAFSSERITFESTALGDVAGGFVELFVPVDGMFGSTLQGDNPIVSGAGELVRVPADSLDGYLALNPVQRSLTVDLLKVDVEGFERAVLEGARATLATHHPVVLCEIEVRHDSKYRETFGLMESLGYMPFVLGDDRLLPTSSSLVSRLQANPDQRHKSGSPLRRPRSNYINNFFFTHPDSRLLLPQV